jgi:hypothetical protein
MRRSPREKLLEAEELVSAAELFARLEARTTALNNSEFAAAFNVLCKSDEAAADPHLAFQLNMERECQLAWLSEYCLTSFSPWKNPAEAEAYLRERKASTKNELLQLRYGLLMLLGLPKGRHTGQLAAELVSTMRQWLARDQGQYEDRQETYYELVQLGFLLSRQYKCEPEKMQRVILDALLGGKQPLVLRWWQLSFFGQHASKLSRIVCEELGLVSQQVYDCYAADNDHILSNVCDSAIQLAARATGDACIWHLRKGDFWRAAAEERYIREPTGFVVQTMFTDALHCYRAGRDKQRVQEVEARISATKHDVRLNQVEVTHTFDGTKGKFLSAYINQLPKRILAGEGSMVFWQMVRGSLVPHARSATLVKQQEEVDSFFRSVAFDNNRNITTRHQKSVRTGPIDTYGLILGFYAAMTRQVFAEGLASGQITLVTTLEFLREHSWLGQAVFFSDPNDEESEYYLLDWVEPALRNYFGEMERAAANEHYTPEMMLCLDSLTLKIEGLLRQYCRLLNPPIATNRTSASGDQQEITLEEILKSVEPYSGEDAGYLLRYIFTKEGWNLRNNIAHGFLAPSNYSADLMQMVLLGLFIVATMGMETPKVADSEKAESKAQ